MLARTIFDEKTRDEEDAQEAIAWLMANRVLVQNKGEFSYNGLPSSLYSIVTRPLAFTCLDKEDGNDNSYTKKVKGVIVPDGWDGWVNAIRLAYELVDVFSIYYSEGKILTLAEKDIIRQQLISSIGNSPIGKGCWYVAEYQWERGYTTKSGKHYYKGSEIYPNFEDFKGNTFFNYIYADI